MHLYIAGAYNAGTMKKNGNIWTSISDTARAQVDSIKHVLESYHYLHNNQIPRLIREDGREIFLDSGAYSAWTQGVEINVENYAQFIKDNGDIVRMASVLDSIGDADSTWRNQVHLEALGCEVVPCFHGEEPIAACRYYARNYPYISLGGMVGGSMAKLRDWLDEVWGEVLTDKDGHAICKVHGFGLTSVELMERYPWYSVDSTSWVMTASFGSIFLPEIGKPISISKRSPSRKILGDHFSTLTKREQDYIKELADKYELDLDQCAEDHKPRYAFNAFAFHRMGELMGDDHWQKPFKHRQRRLFA